MRETPPPVGQAELGPRPRHIVVEVAFLRVLEEYLGDRPHSDKIAADLHARVVVLLESQGLL